jgi:hypothetical protein
MSNVNQVDDDLNNLAKTSLGQLQNVVAAGSGVATTISSRGNATGTTVNPGPSGRGGTGRPGKRLYNPLSKLASYTYNISLYMITPDAYEQFVASGRQKIQALTNAGPVNGEISSGAFVIAQSGGTNNSTTARAPGFELDYYIDNLKFKTMTSSKSAGTNTSAVADFSFTITEPYGFSFLTNLKKATDALKRYNDTTEYKQLTNDFKQIYILGIRFYGYDINGREVTAPTELYGEPIDPLGSGALFENYYDIQISNVKFKLDGRAVVYNVEAVGMNAQALLGVKRGRMPTGLRIQGGTVDDALQGPNGLFTKINATEVAKSSKDPPDSTYPNVYQVVYQGDAEARIGKASIVTQSDLDKTRWPGSNARNTVEATEAKGAKPPDPNERMFTFNNDVSIMQAIEQIIKKSSYMEQALKTIYSNTKQPDPNQKNNPQIDRENPVPLSWFNVSCDIRSLQWDPKLQDWAMVTSYVITTYEIPAVMTPFAPDTNRYYGAHKRYDYWFTGQNSEVLDYQLTFNNLFFNTVLGIESKDFKLIGQANSEGGGREQGASGPGSGPTSGDGKTTSNNKGTKADPPPPGTRDASAGTATAGGTSVQPGVKSNANRTGTLAVGLEAQNSIVTSLHDIEAFSSGQIRIMGDPDFLIRDAATSITELYNKFYDTNGYTVSAQGGQIFIEVKFNEATDYTHSDGLMQINESIFFLNYPQYIKDMTQGAIIYELVEVDSVFSSGTFTQTLHLIMAPFDTGEPPPVGTGGPSGGTTTTGTGAAAATDPDALDKDGILLTTAD